MGKLQDFINNNNDFAEQVGKDIKDLREKNLAIIDDSQESLSSTWSSNKTKTELDKKVDKVVGKGLSDTNFTKAEKYKLSSLEGSKFLGVYPTLQALQTAHSVADAGNYADVDATGEDVVRYIWDVSESKWVAQQSGTPLTAAQIKQMYESNPDTNAFTNDEKTKLQGIQEGAQVNSVNSVSGKQGDVTLVKADVGLGNVQNYAIATLTQAQNATGNAYMTPARTQDYVDNQVGDDNPLEIYNTAAGN